MASASLAAGSGSTSRLRALSARWTKHRWPWLRALLIGLALIVGYRAVTGGASRGTLELSLAAVLERVDVHVDPTTVVWLADDVSTLGTRPALFLATGGEAGAGADVFYTEVRPGLSGAAIYVAWTTDVTHSPGAAEEQLVRAGDFVAFCSRATSDVEAITVLDLRGEPADLTADWTWRQRQQGAITNLQETGRLRGFGRVRYQLHTPASRITLVASGDHFVATGDGLRVVIDPQVEQPIEGADQVDTQPTEKGVPGGVAWVVDTVRNLDFVGPAPIEWLESRVFALADFRDRTSYAWFGPDEETTTAAEEMGVSTAPSDPIVTEERRALLTAAAAEIGFPPPPMTPILRDDPARGEGEWIAIVDDPFVNQYPGAPPAFAQSFIRPDVERPYARVFVTLWDPRQVQLRVMPGTVEPESATGARGTGYIPRDEMTSRMLVAGFDGGFQAMHGEFGMMSEGQVYLPPKPWAATVAVYEDGRVGLGSWPAPNWSGSYDETRAISQIPPGMVEMRQNLTSVVEDGVFNPWERWWWGAAPQTASEQTFTHRSGLCLTREGFLAFFWGSSLGAESLGAAMTAARCSRSMHLDMNSAHTGLELFRPYPTDAPLPAIETLHRDSEFDGVFPGVAGYRIRARRAARSMQMQFPRYLAHDPRDFFYLTLRPTLPGPPLAGASETEGAFSVEGLPHAGWPYAFARTQVDDGWIVRIDPRRAVPDAARADRHQRVLAGLTAPIAGGASTLFAHQEPVGSSWAVGHPRADDRAFLAGALLSDTPAAGAAIGVDRDGFLVYAEGPRPGALLDRAGVTAAIALPDGVRLVLRGDGGAGAGPDGMTPRTIGDGAPTFLAEEAPAAEVAFPDTQPIPYGRWRALQGARVRYFPSEPPRFTRPTEETEVPSTP